ncbi:MAG: carbon-nitrogen hydrolase family protein [Amaricoccus sp.]
MKIAVAAYPIDWMNRWNDYVGKLRVWVRTGAEQGADLLVFPEHGALELASLAGEANARDPDRTVEALTARIKDVDDLHASLAREFRLHICAASGPIRVRDVGTVNRARLFAPDGSRGEQDKLVPSRFEREAWSMQPGAAARVFDTALGRIGVLIGYDAEFPLPARAMAEAGAEILLVPSSTDSVRGHARVRIGAMARALENQCVVAQAVTLGTADWLSAATRSTGTAAIYAPADVGFPENGVVAEGKPDAPGWVIGEVERYEVHRTREEGAVRPFADWPLQGPAPVEAVALGTAAAEA